MFTPTTTENEQAFENRWCRLSTGPKTELMNTLTNANFLCIFLFFDVFLFLAVKCVNLKSEI